MSPARAPRYALALAGALLAAAPAPGQDRAFPPAPRHEAFPERPWGNPPSRAYRERAPERRRLPPWQQRAPRTATGAREYYDPWAPRVERPWGDPWGHTDPTRPYRDGRRDASRDTPGGRDPLGPASPPRAPEPPRPPSPPAPPGTPWWSPAPGPGY